MEKFIFCAVALRKQYILVLEGSISDSYVLNVDDMKISSSDEVILLGVAIDNKLRFKNHIDDVCRKASHKLFYQKKKPGYLQMFLLMVSFFTLL